MMCTEPGDDSSALRILCVDDNAMLSSALGRLIARQPGLAWVGAINTGANLVSKIREARPHVVLMDVDMPGVDTFGVVRQLHTEDPQIRVTMLSGHVDPSFVDLALDCGAWGYLSKNEEVSVLIEEIRRVGAGRVALSGEVEAVKRHADTGRTSELPGQP